jgi:hypothetical protein
VRQCIQQLTGSVIAAMFMLLCISVDTVEIYEEPHDPGNNMTHAKPSCHPLVLAATLPLTPPELSMQALGAILAHPVAHQRVTSLEVYHALPAGAAVHLRNLRDLCVNSFVTVSEIRAMQALSCLTSLTVGGLLCWNDEPVSVLQPKDLPARLHVLSIRTFCLYFLGCALPALITVGGGIMHYDEAHKESCCTPQQWHEAYVSDSGRRSGTLSAVRAMPHAATLLNLHVLHSRHL